MDERVTVLLSLVYFLVDLSTNKTEKKMNKKNKIEVREDYFEF